MEAFEISTSIGNCIAIDAQVDGRVADERSHKPISKVFRAKAKLANLGALEKLPAELLELTLLHLDLKTIVRLRRVSAKARLLVDRHRDYNIIRESAPGAVCALHKLWLASSITCKQLIDTLQSSACESCGKNGAYLYLFTCTRVCWPCFVKEDCYLSLPFTAAQNSFGLNSRILRTLPRIRVKARKSARSERKKGYHFLHNPTAAKQAGVQRHGSLDTMQSHARKKEATRQRKMERRRALGYNVVSRAPDDRKERNWRRYIAVSRIPWVCNATKKVHQGVYCKCCFNVGIRNTFFTQETLDVHLDKCKALSSTR